jgi:hypothetical protein
VKLPTLSTDVEALLGDFVEQFAALGVDPPVAQYVASGLVPWDGESLTVSLGDVNQGQPGAPYAGTYVTGVETTLAVALGVQVLREVPVISGDGYGQMMVPGAAQLNAAGLQTFSDAQALLQAAVNIHVAYEATGPGEGFAIGPLITLGPDGGLAGVRLQLHLSLA